MEKYRETGIRPTHDGNCQRVDRTYRPEDRAEFGDWIPAVCPPGGLRITRPEIIHGSASLSNSKADSERLVLNPWFVGIQKDHQVLDIPECGTWETLVNAHRDLSTLPTTPSGQVNIHGHPKFRFPSSIEFRGFSAISDALIGQRKWTSPAVVNECEILLGSDEEKSKEFVKKVRQRMTDEWERHFNVIRKEEMIAFGENSYFYLQQLN